MTGFFKRSSSKPVMIAIGGLSGSGKSTLAEEIGKRMPGTFVLDADVFRKSLHGVDPTTPLPNHAYSPQNTKYFIRRIHREAEQHLQAGRNVIVTGIFLDKQTRMKQEFLARRNGAEFIGIFLNASASVLFERVAKRQGSASDADRSVLQKQFKSLQNEQKRQARGRSSVAPRPFRELNWQLINANQPLDEMVKGAVLYIHQEHQKMKYRPQPKRNTQKKFIKPVFPQ